MLTQETKMNVKNRSSSVVVYRIPETNLRREFAPGEVKSIPFGELEKLTYQEGGRELLENFLQLIEEEATQDLGVRREPEYNMSEAQVRDLMVSGSLDSFLDALDFAPIGVIDLIKTMAVQLPLSDIAKRKALKEKTGFDVDKALMHIEEEKAEENAPEQQPAVTGRRVQPKTTAAPEGRRTESKYTITKTAEKHVEPENGTAE